MKCRRALRELELRSWVSGSERDPELTEHLAGCPGCRGQAARLASLRPTLEAALPAASLPAGDRARFRARLAEVAPARRAPRAGLRLVWGLALALGAAAGLAWWAGRGEPRPLVVRLEVPDGTYLASEPEVVIERGRR